VRPSLLSKCSGLAVTVVLAGQGYAATTGTWTFTTNINTPTCNISAGTLNKTIPLAGADKLSALDLDGVAAGTGITATKTDWALQVDGCASATMMTVAFSGTPSPGQAATYATGINNLGLYAFEPQTVPGWHNIANGKVLTYPVPGAIPFSAYLFKTINGPVSEGAINAVINFTTSYY
jgi:type 1 fimbria pilin